jgi:hypothetical protein
MQNYAERLAFDTDELRVRHRTFGNFGYVPDASFVTPEAFTSALNQTNADITRLDAQIQASEGTKTGSFRNEWHTFVTNWLDYYKRMSGSYTSRMSGSNYNQLVDIANRQLPTWEAKAKQAGTRMAGPGVDAGEKPPQSPWPDLTGTLKIVAIAGLGIAAVVALSKFKK